MSKHSWDITEVEDALGKTLKRNTVSLGLDVASKSTGICLVKTTQKKFHIEDFYKVQMKGKVKGSVHTKSVKYTQKLVDIRTLLEDLNIPKRYHRRVIIEDCFFKLSPTVLKILSRYETIAFLVFRRWARDCPDPIQPSASRKKVGFSKDRGEFKYDTYKDSQGKTRRKKRWIRKPLSSKDQVKNFISDYFDIDIENDDLADGFILALSGVINV